MRSFFTDVMIQWPILLVIAPKPVERLIARRTVDHVVEIVFRHGIVQCAVQCPAGGVAVVVVAVVAEACVELVGVVAALAVDGVGTVPTKDVLDALGIALVSTRASN